jgi:hypothetical protein
MHITHSTGFQDIDSVYVAGFAPIGVTARHVLLPLLIMTDQDTAFDLLGLEGPAFDGRVEAYRRMRNQIELRVGLGGVSTAGEIAAETTYTRQAPGHQYPTTFRLRVRNINGHNLVHVSFP